MVKYKPGKTYAGWQSLFGSGNGILPAHLLKGKNRDKVMKDGYTWSGGPWFAKWNKGDSRSFSRPTRSTGADKPHLDKVVFKFEADTAAEFQAFKSDQVDAIYPHAELDVVDAIKAGIPDAQHAVPVEHRVGRGAVAPAASASRSTRRPCARRSATRSTASRS